MSELKHNSDYINATISDISSSTSQLQLDDTQYQQEIQLLKQNSADENWREKHPAMRWIALSLACLMLLGLYIGFDYPGFMQNQIEEIMFGYNGKDGDSARATFRYGLLYSIYSLPNIFLPLFGGYLVDRIGVSISSIAFSLCLFVGQFLCAFSVFLGGNRWDSDATFVWMLIGRFVFALGGDNLSIAQKTTISRLFIGKQLSFALGLTISTGRLGSVTAGWLLPPIVENSNGNLFLPIFICDIFCLLGVFCALGLYFLDKKMTGTNLFTKK